jgi:hypothetical protein
MNEPLDVEPLQCDECDNFTVTSSMEELEFGSGARPHTIILFAGLVKTYTCNSCGFAYNNGIDREPAIEAAIKRYKESLNNGI